MTENKKLRNDLKKVITTARSASPMDSALKKSVSMKDEETKEMGRLANVKKVPPRNKKNGFASPQVSKKQKTAQIQEYYCLKSDESVLHEGHKNVGFLNSQRAKGALHINDMTTADELGSNPGSCTTSPLNDHLIQKGGATARIYQKARQESKQMFFQKNGQ